MNRPTIKTLWEYMILFALGGAVYYSIELLWRGYSHISMFVAGGLAFVALGLINYQYEYDMSLIAQTVVGGLIITAIELVFGVVFNLWLGLGVWDYSDMPYNLWGQICLSHIYLWQWLSLVGIILNDYTRHWLFGEQKPKYKIL